MSDVYKTNCDSYDTALDQAVIAISVVVSVISAAIFSLLIMTCILARSVERQLAKTQQANTAEPSVIIVEECRDLQRTVSSLNHTMTLNSKDLLSFYDKLPEQQTEENNSNLMLFQAQAM